LRNARTFVPPWTAKWGGGREGSGNEKEGEKTEREEEKKPRAVSRGIRVRGDRRRPEIPESSSVVDDLLEIGSISDVAPVERNGNNGAVAIATVVVAARPRIPYVSRKMVANGTCSGT